MSKEKTRSIRAPYINREYSWLQFDDRVLDQARDSENPLLERCRFLSIFISNLDEFVRVRLGSLMNLQLHSPDYTDNKSGMDAGEQIDMVLSMLPAYYRKADETFIRLRKELKKAGIDILMSNSISETQKAKAPCQVKPVLAIMIATLSASPALATPNIAAKIPKVPMTFSFAMRPVIAATAKTQP